MKRFITLGSLALVLGLGAFGCQNTAEGVKEDSAQAGQAVAKTTKEAADATKEAAAKTGQAVSEGVKETADATKDAAKNASAALDVTPKVKLAITADKQLNDTRNLINVDSADNVVHLKGHVISKALKDHAGKVAQDALTEGKSTDKLSNELEVQP